VEVEAALLRRTPEDNVLQMHDRYYTVEQAVDVVLDACGSSSACMQALRKLSVASDPATVSAASDHDGLEQRVRAILLVHVRARARAHVHVTGGGRHIVNVTADQARTARRAEVWRDQPPDAWRALVSMPMGSPEWARTTGAGAAVRAVDELSEGDVLPARDVRAVLRQIDRATSIDTTYIDITERLPDICEPAPLFVTLGTPPLASSDKTLVKKLEEVFKQLQCVRGGMPPVQLLYGIALELDSTGELARSLLSASTATRAGTSTVLWSRYWAEKVGRLLRPFYISTQWSNAGYTVVRVATPPPRRPETLIPIAHLSPRPHPCVPQYSNVTRGCALLSEVPRAPLTRLEEAHGLVRVRHDELVVERHPQGDCPAEAVAFATGKASVGEAVAVARARLEEAALAGSESAVRERGDGLSLHAVHDAIRPYGYELRCELRAEEEEGSLTFFRVCSRLLVGMHLLKVIVCDERGNPRAHMMVWDAWRRLLFLGAGELTDEWIAGVIGVTTEDLAVRARLDERLREQLRVLSVCAVRSVWEVPSREKKSSECASVAEGAKRKRPSTCARAKFKKLCQRAAM
jgi:hypothetical protein